MRTPALLILVLACCHTVCFGATDEPLAFWRKAVVRLAAVPAEPTWGNGLLKFQGPGFDSCRMRCFLPAKASSLPPVVYLLDRENAAEFKPGTTHAWIVLDMRGLPATVKRADPVLHPLYKVTLTAHRGLQLLLMRSSATRAGIVGEGRGATMAMGLAALAPHQTSFVCAYQPTATPEAGLDPYLFAAEVRAPTLVGLGLRDRIAPATSVYRVHNRLRCTKELAEFRTSRHCAAADLKVWQDTWREWVREVGRL